MMRRISPLQGALQSVLALGLGCGIAIADSPAQPAEPSPEISADEQVTLPHLTIMTANTTSGKRQSYQAPGERIFKAIQADVIAIQEFNLSNNEDPRAWVDRVFGKDFHFMIEPGDDDLPCGIVSRYPITASGEWKDLQVGNRDFAWASIDIPGPVDLHLISIHLHSSGGSSSRDIQANQIVDEVKKQFPATDYVALCGDLNTRTRNEAAVRTFRELFIIGDPPTDQLDNSDTSKNRNHPYDWVLTNEPLSKRQRSLTVGGKQFPRGLVFDTRLWENPPAPALATDSGVPGMQHMAVIKSFNLSSEINAEPGDTVPSEP